METLVKPLQDLIEKFRSLNGVGKKSATKMAFAVLELSEEQVGDFARAIVQAKEKIHLCPVCQNLTDRDVCYVCNDLGRDRSVICVVSDVKTLISMEKVTL